MSKRIIITIIIILTLSFFIEFKHEFQRDYRSIVIEIRGWMNEPRFTKETNKTRKP